MQTAFKVEGSMQLYNEETGGSRAIEGHAAAFTELTLEVHQAQ